MSDFTPPVNTAPLRNVALFVQLMDRLMTRSASLPGMGMFYGPSGYGKTTSAIYGAQKYRAYHVMVRSVWTSADLVKNIARKVLGAQAKITGNRASIIAQFADQLARSSRPLILDEADFLAEKKSMIEVARDIYEASLAPVILIGEEGLPQKIRAYERVDGRMLDWVPAQPVGLEDSRHLARLYAPDMVLADDLLDHLTGLANGSARRVAVNLDHVREMAALQGVDTLDLAGWQALGGVAFTGIAPARGR
jgi:predicted metal-dependent hydrolase